MDYNSVRAPGTLIGYDSGRGFASRRALCVALCYFVCDGADRKKGRDLSLSVECAPVDDKCTFRLIYRLYFFRVFYLGLGVVCILCTAVLVHLSTTLLLLLASFAKDFCVMLPQERARERERQRAELHQPMPRPLPVARAPT